MRKVLVLMGDGINSENELAQAFAEHGASVKLVHINHFLKDTSILKDYQLLALPGGFSFGDELRSGKILAEKLKDAFSDQLTSFLARDGRVLGICNGFQVLAQLGAFNWVSAKRSFTLAENDHGKFMNRWTKLEIASEAHVKSPWFQDLTGSIFLPVRHREGRVVKGSDTVPFAPLTYANDINGSYANIAGLVSDDGQVFGLMPHPEVATRAFLHPFEEHAQSNAKKVQQIFKNGLL